MVDLFPSLTHLVKHKVHEFVDRSFFGGAIEGDLAILQEINSVADIKDVGVVVGNDDHCHVRRLLELTDHI
jgi:hypothetical protein